jgi:competence protein ComEC
MQTVYFYSGVGGFFAGVAGVLVGLPGWPTAVLLGLLTIAVMIIGYAGIGFDRFVVLAIIVLAATGLGVFRASFANTADSNYEFASVVDKSVQATGTIVSRPTQTDNGQSFTVRIDTLRLAEEENTVSGSAKSAVYAERFPQLAYGDVIRIGGQLRKPETFTGTGGREFYYPEYLARKDIFYEISRPQIDKVDEQQGGWLQQSLADFRAQLLQKIHEYVPDPHAALTGGVLLGAEDALGEGLQEDFRRTSVIHIVVLSGFNVMIVAAVIGQGLLALGLSLGVSAAAATIGIVLFALLVGLTPTVVRASIMAVFALLARASGRRYGPTRGLVLAAAGMVLVTPDILLYDPSFQLSAVATAGLIGFGDQVSAWLDWVPKRFGLHEAATATVAAQIAVLPLLLFYTGMLSFVSLPANLFVLPVVPLLMAVGAVTILFGFISSTLAFVSASGVYVIADYVFLVVRWLAGTSYATVSLPAVSIWGVLSVYMGLFALAYWLHEDKQVTHALPNPDT